MIGVHYIFEIAITLKYFFMITSCSFLNKVWSQNSGLMQERECSQEENTGRSLVTALYSLFFLGARRKNIRLQRKSHKTTAVQHSA